MDLSDKIFYEVPPGLITYLNKGIIYQHYNRQDDDEKLILYTGEYIEKIIVKYNGICALTSNGKILLLKDACNRRNKIISENLVIIDICQGSDCFLYALDNQGDIYELKITQNDVWDFQIMFNIAENVRHIKDRQYKKLLVHRQELMLVDELGVAYYVFKEEECISAKLLIHLPHLIENVVVKLEENNQLIVEDKVRKLKYALDNVMYFDVYAMTDEWRCEDYSCFSEEDELPQYPVDIESSEEEDHELVHTYASIRAITYDGKVFISENKDFLCVPELNNIVSMKSCICKELELDSFYITDSGEMYMLGYEKNRKVNAWKQYFLEDMLNTNNIKNARKTF